LRIRSKKNALFLKIRRNFSSSAATRFKVGKKRNLGNFVILSSLDSFSPIASNAFPNLD